MGSKMYFLGGIDVQNGYTRVSDVGVFDLETETWSTAISTALEKVSSVRKLMVVFKGKVLVRGGH